VFTISSGSVCVVNAQYVTAEEETNSHDLKINQQTQFVVHLFVGVYDLHSPEYQFISK